MSMKSKALEHLNEPLDGSMSVLCVDICAVRSSAP